MTDPIEEQLLHIERELMKAWQGSRCLTCPIGELAALAAATRVFYQEQKRKEQAVYPHWTTAWQKERSC